MKIPKDEKRNQKSARGLGVCTVGAKRPYEAPILIPLGGLDTGWGLDCISGSSPGVSSACNSGGTADGECDVGTSAATNCKAGSAAVTKCQGGSIN
jgi:hypothetical protein